jgi:hypothetical protein
MRILIFQDDASGVLHAVDIADPARARRLAAAPNARVVRRRKDRAIVEIHLSAEGDDSKWKPEIPRGNPRRYSSDRATPANPHGVWKLKHLPADTAPLYRLSVTDCLAKS